MHICMDLIGAQSAVFAATIGYSSSEGSCSLEKGNIYQIIAVKVPSFTTLGNTTHNRFPVTMVDNSDGKDYYA